MSKRSITIGLAGLYFESTNLGCKALALSFYSGLVEVLKKNNIQVSIISFSTPTNTSEFIDTAYPIEFVEYHLSDIRGLKRVWKAVKQCGYYIDFTEGDSFSDLYGRAHFYRSIAVKIMALACRVKIILGPQTYGPFENFESKIISKYILNHAYRIYSRDKESGSYLESLNFGVHVFDNTDVAFLLPYKKNENKTNLSKIKVGLNVSGLLYKDRELLDKQYGLKTDYILYNENIVQWLLEQGVYEVHLIPHVGTCRDVQGSDAWACSCIKEKYPECILHDGFENPSGAKSLIAEMAIFIGARMHATIGAFSANVFTIPFAYSRKFSGYYNQLEYPVLVDGCKLETTEAIERTIVYITEREKYLESSQKSNKLAKNKLQDFYKELVEVFKESE